MKIELQNTKPSQSKVKFLLLFTLVAFVFLSEIYASDNLKLQGKWTAYVYVSLPDGCVLNDSTCRAYGIIPNMTSTLYFNENGQGFYDNPARKNVIEFKWHLSNDTIHILNNDTLVLYKIDKKDIRTGTTELYLRLLSKETKSFPFSYVVMTSYLKTSDFVIDLSIKLKELNADIRETINYIKKKRRVDEVVVGYEKDKKYHYTYLSDNKENSDNSLFDGIQNWKNRSKFILFILYDEKMQSLQKIRNYVFRIDNLSPEGISFDTSEDFPITQDVK